jgi:hypothetical protein
LQERTAESDDRIRCIDWDLREEREPVIAFGRTLLQDLYASAPLAATFLPKASVSEPGASPDTVADPADDAPGSETEAFGRNVAASGAEA